MRKLLLILLTITGLLFSEETEKKKKNSYFVDNFLKYSTFYFSVGLDSPFAPANTFSVDTGAGTFEETTQEIESSYNLTIGVRKLARFKYQVKKANFYDGSEDELSEKATKLADGLNEAAESTDFAFHAKSIGGMFGLYFCKKSAQIDTFSDLGKTNLKLFNSFFAFMLENRVYLAPSAFEAGFISIAHSDEDIQKTVDLAKSFFRDNG